MDLTPQMSLLQPDRQDNFSLKLLTVLKRVASSFQLIANHNPVVFSVPPRH